MLPLFDTSRDIPLGRSDTILTLIELSTIRSGAIQVLIDYLSTSFIILLESPGTPFESITILLDTITILLVRSRVSLDYNLD